MKSSVLPSLAIGCFVAGCVSIQNATDVSDPCDPQPYVVLASVNPCLSISGFPPLEESGIVPISSNGYLPYSWLAICVGQNKLDRPELLQTNKPSRESRFLDIWHLRDSFTAEPYLSLFFHGSSIEQLQQDNGLQISNVVSCCIREEFMPAGFQDAKWSTTVSGDKATVELHGEKNNRCIVRLKRVWPMPNRFLWKLENVEDENETESMEWFGWRDSGSPARFPTAESVVSEGFARIRSLEVRSRFYLNFACLENTSTNDGENIRSVGAIDLPSVMDAFFLRCLLFLGHDALFERLLNDSQLPVFELNLTDAGAMSRFREFAIIPLLQDERRFSESIVRALYGVSSQELPESDDDQLDMLVRHCRELGYCGEPGDDSVSWMMIKRGKDDCLVELKSYGLTTDCIHLKKRWLSRNRSAWFVTSFSGPLVIF